MKAHPILILTLAALIAPLAASASTIRPPEGTTVMAKAGSPTLFLWNSTPFVAHLVSDKVLGSNGMNAIEATAISLLADKAKSLSAASVAIRVIYEKTGAVSRVYGTPTFAGVENVMTLTADRRLLERNAVKWAAQAQGGSLPAGLRVTVTGTLPPPQ